MTADALKEMRLTMNKWKVLLLLEYEWRIFRFYRKVLNWLIKRGVRLSSPTLCLVGKKLDKHSTLVSELKHLYEHQTGEIIVFFKYNEY